MENCQSFDSYLKIVMLRSISIYIINSLYTCLLSVITKYVNDLCSYGIADKWSNPFWNKNPQRFFHTCRAGVFRCFAITILRGQIRRQTVDLRADPHETWEPPGRFLDNCMLLFNFVQSWNAGIMIQPFKNISSGTFWKKKSKINNFSSYFPYRFCQAGRKFFSDGILEFLI